MTPIGPALLERFLDCAAARLGGSWVVVGGSVLLLVGRGARETFDIDLAAPKDAGAADLLALLEVAESLGLPAEAVNQAATWFLHRIPDHERHLVVVRTGRAATISRPDATLFVLLKLSRLSESDLEDALEMLRFASESGEPLDRDRLLAAIAAESTSSTSPGRSHRLDALAEALRTPPPAPPAPPRRSSPRGPGRGPQ